MRKGLIFLCLLVILMLWLGLGVSGEGRDHICFRSLDVDSDGKVSFEEFSAHYGKDEKTFKDADGNGDGLLTHDEYHGFLGHGAAENRAGK